LCLGNGDLLVSGNWYNSDQTEVYSAEGNAFTISGTPASERSYPLMFPTSADNAIIFGPVTNHGSRLEEIWIDRYSGEAYQLPVFDSWKPMYVGTSFRAENCAIADYTYLIMLDKFDEEYYDDEKTYGLGIVKGEDITELPCDFEVPSTSDYGPIMYAGPVIVDKSKKVGYAFGSTGKNNDVVCFILKVDYSEVFDGGKAKLTLYYTDPIETFPGAAGQSGIVLMPDGRLLVAGGIYDSNGSPYALTFAFKPF